MQIAVNKKVPRARVERFLPAMFAQKQSRGRVADSARDIDAIAGAYELKMRTDVPARVVITEYVAVASAFFERAEAGMTNAVLDRLARQLRSGELDEKAPRFSA